ncbi:zinc knuckle CX2CX4HX4C containing protein, partial [Tanacetum coccineum]
GIELGKYLLWSELTRENRKEVLDTIGDIWDALVEESVTRANSSDLVVSKYSESVNTTFDNNTPSMVAPSDSIVQSLYIHKQPSSYVGAAGGSKTEPSKLKANFCSLCLENLCDGAKFSIPRKVVETVSTRFDNTLYGYFIGKRIAFPVVQYYARNNWGKYGLTRIMMNSKGFFFFKFKTSKGLDDILENGPWMIRNIPIILKKWPFRICLKHYRVSNSCLIEINAEDVLQESLTMGVPLIEGMGFTIETVTIEYEWKPPRCDQCKIFGHVQDHCPKKVLITPSVVTSNVATPTIEKTNYGFQTVGKKKKKDKSKSTNGGQFGGHMVKQTVRYEPKAITSIPKKETTNVGNASKSSSMLKTTITSTMNDNIPVSNPYSALDEESEEEVASNTEKEQGQ